MNIAAFIAACKKLYIPEEEAFRQLVYRNCRLQWFTRVYWSWRLSLYDAVTVACVCTHTCTHTHTHTHTHTQLCSAGDIKEL